MVYLAPSRHGAPTARPERGVAGPTVGEALLRDLATQRVVLGGLGSPRDVKDITSLLGEHDEIVRSVSSCGSRGLLAGADISVNTRLRPVVTPVGGDSSVYMSSRREILEAHPSSLHNRLWRGRRRSRRANPMGELPSLAIQRQRQGACEPRGPDPKRTDQVSLGHET